MPITERTVNFSNEGTRQEVRMRVAIEFLMENAGTGKGEEASKYVYYVEKLSDGNRVYLQRPANFNKGLDFLICVENINYAKSTERKRNRPQHDDIVNDLKIKKEENPKMYEQLYFLINEVFCCHDVSDEEISNVCFDTGFSVDHILKVLKWFFIEQDIRYWNYSGRFMLFAKIPCP